VQVGGWGGGARPAPAPPPLGGGGGGWGGGYKRLTMELSPSPGRFARDLFPTGRESTPDLIRGGARGAASQISDPCFLQVKECRAQARAPAARTPPAASPPRRARLPSG